MDTATITIPAHEVRPGDRLDDGTYVYDHGPSALTPGHHVIASAINGASQAIVLPRNEPIEVQRP